jgi:hypothetical protein
MIQKLIPGQTEIKKTNDLIKLSHRTRHWFMKSIVRSRWKSIRRNSVPPVRYRGVHKSRTDNKFGEFTLPLRTSKINITQAIDRLFARVSRCNRAHLSSYGGKSCMSVHCPTQTTQNISNKPYLHAFHSVNTNIIERVQQ